MTETIHISHTSGPVYLLNTSTADLLRSGSQSSRAAGFRAPLRPVMAHPRVERPAFAALGSAVTGHRGAVLANAVAASRPSPCQAAFHPPGAFPIPGTVSLRRGSPSRAAARASVRVGTLEGLHGAVHRYYGAAAGSGPEMTGCPVSHSMPDERRPALDAAERMRVMRTGRVTSPVVEAAMELRELVMSDAKRDGRITGQEQRVIDWCRKVVYLADRADSSLAVANALLTESGIDSANAERRFRETKTDRLRIVEPVTDSAA